MVLSAHFFWNLNFKFNLATGLLRYKVQKLHAYFRCIILWYGTQIATTDRISLNNQTNNVVWYVTVDLCQNFDNALDDKDCLYAPLRSTLDTMQK